jgi:hypothetical protein
MGSHEHQRPRPEWLAAYLDGELDWNAKKQVEDWLEHDPVARADLEDQRQIQRLLAETTPWEPEPAAWSECLKKLEQGPRPVSKPWRFGSASGWVAAILAMGMTAAVIAWALNSFQDKANQLAQNSEEEAAFAVATADEIEILSVEGADHPSLAVGEMPVRGPLELLAPGEFTVTSVQPAAGDNMTPVVPQGPDTPMIWAPIVAQK